MQPVIEGYDDLVPIGSGGFAVVYRARQQSVDRTVALKVLGTLSADPAARTRFERESKALGALSGHPHIVDVYDAGFSSDGVPFLVMEYLAKGSVGDQLRREGAISWSTALRVGIDIGQALAAAHEVGVLHRDVKPDNVLIGRRGEFKLGDFGIAGVVENSKTASAVLAMSVDHVAPEILDGVRASVVSDVYSLGSTLYEMLSGRPPFGREPSESMLQQVVRIGRSPSPRLVECPGVVIPAAVSEAVASLMAKDPAQRVQKADLAVDLLRQVLSSVELEAVSLGESLSRDARQERAGDRLVKAVPDKSPTVRLPQAAPGPSVAPSARPSAPVDAPVSGVGVRSRRAQWIAGVAALLILGVTVGALIAFRGAGSADGKAGAADPVSETTGASATTTTTAEVFDVQSDSPTATFDPNSGTVALTELQVGDCWRAGSGPNRFRVIDCEDFHNAQVFAVFELTDEQLASDDLLVTAFDLCAPAFETNVNDELVEGAVDVLPSLPLASNRTMVCSLSTADSISQSLVVDS